MMPVPAPPRPSGPDTPPVLAPYTPPSERNAAAITSLICAILWPLCFSITPVWNATTNFAPVPEWVGTLVAFSLIILPPLGLITAVVGLVRSFSRPLLHRTHWQAIVGLIFGLMWLGYSFVL
jgi:hypothetical protein